MCGDEFTIADICWFPWIRNIDIGYAAKDYIGLDNYVNLNRWLKECTSRPSCERGLVVNSKEGKFSEYHSEWSWKFF